MILAVDFDGTLVTSKWPDIGEPKWDVIKFVKRKVREGYSIILWTCREQDKLAEAMNYCHSVLGLRFDAVNNNLAASINTYGHNSRKIHADLYLDDKNLSIKEIE